MKHEDRGELTNIVGGRVNSVVAGPGFELSNRAKRRDFAASDEDFYPVGRLPKVLKEA
jgi:hypothetical protein